MLLNYVENPGVYVIKDHEEVYVFDHVACRITQANNDRLLLELENSTGYDAVVTLFEENAGQQSRTMGINPWKKYRKVTIGGHEKIRAVVDK